jgi:hypothetical protein
MTSEAKWALFWAGLVVTFAVAETVANRSGNPHAPLSHHMRRHTRILGKTPLGQAALYAGAGWLYRHLYEPIKEMK